MNRLKKFASITVMLLLAINMIVPSFAIAANAASAPALSINGKTVNQGEEFTIAVNLQNAANRVYNGNFTLQYDSSKVDIVSFAYGSIFNDHTKNCNTNYKSTGNQIRFTFSGAYALKQDGTLVTFTFRAKSDISGTASLKFTAYKLYDENGISLGGAAADAAVTITGKASVTPKLSLTGGTVKAGSTITVPISISNSSAIYNGNFTLQYDNTLLSAESFEYGSIFNDHTKNCNLDYKSTGNQIRFTFSGAYALKQDGILVNITFKVKENLSGTAALQFTAFKMYDENGISITSEALKGSIVVTSKPDEPITPPDENTPQIVVENARAFAGDTVTVFVTLKNNPGFAGLNVYLTYSEALTLIDATCSVDALTFTNDKTIVLDSAANYAKDGQLLKLVFKVSDSAETTNQFVKINFIEAFNESLNNITFETVDGYIEVLDYIYGDANGDGVINTKDIILLRRHIAAKDPATGESAVTVSAGADANGDGVVNTKDIILLRHYIAAKDPLTGESSVVLGPKK